MNPDDKIIENAVKNAASDLKIGYQEVQDKLQFLRFYDNLYSMFGGNLEQMVHWFYSGNSYLKYTPVLRINNNFYVKQMNEYLEAFRYR